MAKPSFQSGTNKLLAVSGSGTTGLGVCCSRATNPQQEPTTSKRYPGT